MILHFTISEYHFPTNCTPYVCSCDTLFKIIKSWQHFHFSQKCAQSRNPSPLTVICKFQIWQNNFPWYKDAPAETWWLVHAHFNREYYKVRYWADTEISRGAIIHNDILKLMQQTLNYEPMKYMIYKGCDSMLRGQIHWKVWKSWQGMQDLIILLWMRWEPSDFPDKSNNTKPLNTNPAPPPHQSQSQTNQQTHSCTHCQIHLIQTSLHFLPCLHLDNHWPLTSTHRNGFGKTNAAWWPVNTWLPQMSSLWDPMMKSSWLFGQQAPSKCKYLSTLQLIQVCYLCHCLITWCWIFNSSLCFYRKDPLSLQVTQVLTIDVIVMT